MENAQSVQDTENARHTCRETECTNTKHGECTGYDTGNTEDAQNAQGIENAHTSDNIECTNYTRHRNA